MFVRIGRSTNGPVGISLSNTKRSIGIRRAVRTMGDFGEEQSSWLDKVLDIYKKNRANIREGVKTAISRNLSKSESQAAQQATAETTVPGEDTLFGMPKNVVYIGAGLLIAAGIGYIIYNRTKN